MSLLRHHQLLMSASAQEGDPFFANVELLYHNEDIIQSGSPATITDSSINMRNHPNSVGMGVTKNSSIFKFGSSSMRINGIASAQRLIFLADQLPVPGTADFCIEFWFRTELNDTFPNFFFSGANTGTDSFYFAKLPEPNVLFVNKPGTDLQGTTPVTTGVWHHVAFARSGGVSRIFLNGGLEGSIADATNYSSTAARTLFGTRGGVQDYYIDEFRYTIGHGRYDAPFTPPTGPFPDF